ncbi:AAA family ATPase [Rhizobium sp. WYCCWR 11146]|uniref:AAA family ATPase n=1 Tax=Rhizobium sp. WYCCWR 11146 TaxID=2749833 RepID=UPI0015E7DF04|nr:AAA family ATPase [Rhizobium sp. WYCCWR 11146]
MRNSIVLSMDQKAAIAKAKAWFVKGRETQQVFRLFGYAGTGKSTVQQALLQELNVDPSEVLFLAPTGKAASVLISKGHDAKTIHKALYTQTGEDDSVYEALEREALSIRAKLTAISLENRSAYLRRLAAVEAQMNDSSSRPKPQFSFRGTTAIGSGVKIVIIDECSMIRNDTYSDLLSLELPIMLVGDPGQLPAVEGSNPPPSLVTDTHEADVMLENVVRQHGNSSILELATIVRRGEIPEFGESKRDGEHVVYKDARGCRGNIEKIFEKAGVEYPEYFDQIICGRNVTRFAINDYMKRRHGIRHIFPVGERVEKLIVYRNIFIDEHFIANGAEIRVEEDRTREGEIKPYSRDDRSIDHPVTITSLDGKPVRIGGASLWKLPFEGHAEFEARERVEKNAAAPLVYAQWSWAITAHKSQGSEWGRVCVFDESDVFRDHRSRWLYSAVTRSSRDLLMIKV